MKKFVPRFTLTSFSLLVLVGMAFGQQYAIDVGVQNITSPNSGCGLGANTEVTASVKNFGLQDQTDVTVILTYNGIDYPETIFGTIPSGAALAYTFTQTVNLSATGSHVITARTQLTGDLNTANDQATKTVINSGAPVATYPYSQDFETPNHGWTASSTGTFVLGTPNKTNTNSAYSGVNSWVNGGLTGYYNANEQSFVLSPCFSFANLLDPIVELAISWQTEGGYDGAKLQATTNEGQTWTDIGLVQDTVNWYNDNSIDGLAWAGPTRGWAGRASTNTGSGGWKIARHGLSTLAGQSSVRFRIAFGADGSVQDEGFAFDDFRIFDQAAYDVQIKSLNAFTRPCGLTNAEQVTVRIKNNGILPASNFSVSYQIDDQPIITETITDTIPRGASLEYTFATTANLADSTSYQFTFFTTYGPDVNVNDTLRTTIYNTLQQAPLSFNFEQGQGSLSGFILTTRPKSRILVNTSGGETGSGMIMDGSAQSTGWSDVQALTNPFGPTSNPDFFSSAVVCVDPQNFATLGLTFKLKQLYKDNALYTNFRVTVNGQPVALTRNGVEFVPSNNNQALRPADQGPSTGWDSINVNLTPFLGSGPIQIGLESSVKLTYNTGTGTANLIDNLYTYGLRTITETPEMAGSQFAIYPNPTTGQITIANNNLLSGNTTIQLLDLTGRVVYTKTLNFEDQQEKPLNLTALPKGLYLMKVSNDLEENTQKVVLY